MFVRRRNTIRFRDGGERKVACDSTPSMQGQHSIRIKRPISGMFCVDRCRTRSSRNRGLPLNDLEVPINDTRPNSPTADSSRRNALGRVLDPDEAYTTGIGRRASCALSTNQRTYKWTQRNHPEHSSTLGEILWDVRGFLDEFAGAVGFVSCSTDGRTRFEQYSALC